MEWAIKEKNFVKNLKYPKVEEVEQESNDLELAYCPKWKLRKKAKKYELIDAYDTHKPIKWRHIAE